MHYFSAISFFNMLLAIALGIWVFSKDPVNRLNRNYLIFCLISAYTALCEFFRLTAIDEPNAYFWHTISVLWPFFPAVFLDFVLILSKSEVIKKKYYYLFLISPAVFVLILHLIPDLIYDGLIYEWYGWDFIAANSIAALSIPIYFAVYGILSLFVIIKYYRKQSEYRLRRQALLAILGVAISIGSGYITEGLLPQIGIPTPPLNSTSFMIGAVFLSVSVTKYNFFVLDPLETINKLFSTIQDYMLIVDEDLKIILASDSVCALTGYPLEFLKSNKIDVLFFNNFSFRNPHSMEGKEFEIIFKTEHNEPAPVSITLSKIYEYEKKRNFYLLLGRDFRERKKFENQLLQLHKDLEKQVNLRTNDLLESNYRLRDEINTRKEAEKIILANLKEKETLVKEIHHRVKNNLQVVSSLLFLQSNKTDVPAEKNVFIESQNRIRTIALVHEKLYQSDNLSKIRLLEYIKNLTEHIYKSYKKSQMNIDFHFTGPAIEVQTDTAILVGLIVHELVSNSLKHSFDEKKSGYFIRIDLEYKNEECIFTIIDNGCGLPQNFSLINQDTLGLQLVESLIKQLKGNISFESSSQTKFSLRFPMK